MDGRLFFIIYSAGTLYFGWQILRLLPTLFGLLNALSAGAVNWPGPRIHNPDPSASVVRERLGVGYENLFSTFVWNTAGIVGVFVFLLLTLIASTPLMSGHIVIDRSWILVFLALAAVVGGLMAKNQALRNKAQIDIILADLASTVEPRGVDGRSAEAEYVIEHPLIGNKRRGSDDTIAMNLFYESVRCLQDNDQMRAINLYQEALQRQPALHENSVEIMSDIVREADPADAGALYYWLGIHSAYLSDHRNAATWYEKAIDAFNQIGYTNRAARAHCNLGHMKMRLGDPSGMEEFEKAIALNPRDGTAHLNIARAYYMASSPGDPGYDRAMDAFADAIVADPETYGPKVVSSLRDLGYTWREDLEEIAWRVENKRRDDPLS